MDWSGAFFAMGGDHGRSNEVAKALCHAHAIAACVDDEAVRQLLRAWRWERRRRGLKVILSVAALAILAALVAGGG